MKEKRRHKRIQVNSVYGKMLLTSDNVEIINLSLGGAALKVNRNLSVEKEYTIKFEDGDKQIELKGIVVWSVPKEEDPDKTEAPEYHAGIKFDEIFNSKAIDLINFIESNKNTNSKERLRGMRVTINSVKKAILYDHIGYKVKLISSFGMLIEGMQPLIPEEKFFMEIFLKDMAPFKVHIQKTHEEGLPLETFLKNSKTIKFWGKIISCTEIKDSDPKCYDIGIEFLEMHAKDWANLEEFIRSISAGA